MADGPVRTDARTVLMNVAAIDLVLLWAVLVAHWAPEDVLP
jgi:hypothetical protein